MNAPQNNNNITMLTHTNENDQLTQANIIHQYQITLFIYCILELCFMIGFISWMLTCGIVICTWLFTVLYVSPLCFQISCVSLILFIWFANDYVFKNYTTKLDKILQRHYESNHIDYELKGKLSVLPLLLLLAAIAYFVIQASHTTKNEIFLP